MKWYIIVSTESCNWIDFISMSYGTMEAATINQLIVPLVGFYNMPKPSPQNLPNSNMKYLMLLLVSLPSETFPFLVWK